MGNNSRIKLDCIDCSGPTSQRIASFTSEFLDSPNHLISSVLSTIDEEETNLMQRRLDRMVMEAPHHCRHHPDYGAQTPLEPRPIKIALQSSAYGHSESNTSYLIPVVTVAILGLLALVASIVLLHAFVSFQYRRWVDRLPHDHLEAIHRAQQVEEEKQKRINDMSYSIFLSKNTHPIARWGIPVLLLLSAALFLIGIISVGITVKVKVELGGRGFFESDYPFTIVGVASDAWNRGGKLLSVRMI